ncbi:MAG: cyclase family protein [Rhodospirillaceae bacterium]|jgi:arylformamidase|nr:cyclase family protein [Rhodospirillaceae bacterium]
MPRFVELSRALSDGMAGINPDYTVSVRTRTTRARSAKRFGGQCAFETSEVSFPVPVGTYIDSPFARDPEGRDIAALPLDELVRPGLLLDLRGLEERHAVRPSDLPSDADYEGRALIFDFGWSEKWNTPAYDLHPFLPRETVEWLLARGAAMVCVDCRSPDDSEDPARPAHTLCLRAGAFIVENLIGLDALHGRRFRFFAIPARVEGATSFPVRAFAEIED